MGNLTPSKLNNHLWAAADILRGSIDSSDYKNYIFGFLFLKRLSDRFEEEAEHLIAQGEEEDVAWTDPDEHQFFVPKRARWKEIGKLTKDIGDALNKACASLEEDNTTLEGVLLGIDFNDNRKLGDGKQRDSILHRLIGHFSELSLRNADLSEPDMLGRAYEYLIEKFADDAGKKGGEFYTPQRVVELITAAARSGRRHANLRSNVRIRRHAHSVRSVHRQEERAAPWYRPDQRHAARPGEEPRHLGDLQDEHAAAWSVRRAHREGRHHPRSEACSMAAS